MLYLKRLMNLNLIATLDWAEADIAIVDKIIEEAGEREKNLMS